MKVLVIILLLPAIILNAGESIVRGKVVETISRNPIVGANVFLEDKNIISITDSLGEFIFPNLSPGKYNIRVSILGYKDKWINTYISKSSHFIKIDLDQKFFKTEEVLISSNSNIIHDNTFLSSASLSGNSAKRISGNFNDIMRSISSLPGIGKSDELRNDLIVRGGSPSENLFLVDGFLVQNINHFGNQSFTGGTVCSINPDFIRNISFSSGGFPVMYGDKLSSVTEINLVKNQNKLSTSASFLGTQFGFNIDGVISEKLSYIFSIRKSYLDPVFRYYNYDYTPEYYDLLNKISFKLSNENYFTFLFIGALDKIKFHNFDFLNDNKRALGSKQNKYFAGISFNKVTGTSILNLSLSRNFLYYSSIENLLMMNRSTEIDNTAKADLTYKLSPNSEINTGVNTTFIQNKIYYSINNYRNSFSEKYNYHINSSGSFIKAAGYFQLKHRFNFGLDFISGLRYDYFDALSYDKYFSPRLSLKYSVNPTTTLAFSTGVYFQSPAYSWIAGDIQNKILKELKAEHYILSLNKYLDDHLRLSVELYYKNYKDYAASVISPQIVMANVGAQFAGTDDNFFSFGIEPLVSGGKGDSRGFEFYLQQQSSQNPLSASLSVSYNETNFSGLDKIKRPGSFDQRWVMNLLVEYNLSENLSANLKYFYASGKPYTPFNSDGKQLIEQYNLFRMSSSSSLDFRIENRFEFIQQSLLIYLDVKNILNKENIYLYYWDPERKTVTHDPAVRIVPSIGFILQLNILSQE